MADAHALGACGETRGGSSPLPPIISVFNMLMLNEYAAVIQLVECHLAKVDVTVQARSAAPNNFFGGFHENQRFFA